MQENVGDIHRIDAKETGEATQEHMQERDSREARLHWTALAQGQQVKRHLRLITGQERSGIQPMQDEDFIMQT